MKRYSANPILAPNRNHSWEAEAVFNPCPTMRGKTIHLLYRALSLPHYHAIAKTTLQVSDIGIAESNDGIHFSHRRRFIIPEYEWEQFGCEDPRVTYFNGMYYIFYTALSTYPPRANGINIGVAVSRDLRIIQEKHRVTPFNAKAMALFPEKIEGNIWAILTVHTDRPPAKICLISCKKEQDLWSEHLWRSWYKNFESHSLDLARRPQDHIEVGAPPIKTKDGWLLFYSYIKNYFSGKRLFGVEAILLDLKNPHHILAKTKAPLLTPEEYYERIGLVPYIVFPSGAITRRNKIYFYYGAADTTCCLAYMDAKALTKKLLRKEKGITLRRAKENPIISPRKEYSWESKATFNPAALFLKGKVHLLYRALSQDNTSVFGYATSADGVIIDKRSSQPAYSPRELFEKKIIPDSYSGCEDPRLTKINNTIYMTYTACDGKNSPRVALTSIQESDFLCRLWNWTKPILISPPDLDDKDACIFPKKINGKYLIFHRVGSDIDYAFSQKLAFENNTWLEENRWISTRKGMWDSKKIGIAAPPLQTKDGWILLYHGVSDEDGRYRVGALLLDLKDPLTILARSDEPLFEPEAEYEKTGLVAHVVFPCGAVHIGDTIFVYYGGGDLVIGVATVPLKMLLKNLKTCTV
jgi:predicted GH43/DUF377 family glycosyl hydrolase